MRNIIQQKINLLLDTYNLKDVHIFHIRNTTKNKNVYYTYKDKPGVQVTDFYDKGITVLLTRRDQNLQTAICSISYCSSEDFYCKNIGTMTCLERLDTYFQGNDTQEEYIFKLEDMDVEKELLIDFVSEYLNKNNNQYLKSKQSYILNGSM